jgi:hypothetical protein
MLASLLNNKKDGLEADVESKAIPLSDNLFSTALETQLSLRKILSAAMSPGLAHTHQKDLTRKANQSHLASLRRTLIFKF